jgi:hypothetical protein
MADEPEAAGQDDWPVTWAAQREDQLARALAASPAERLAWLEEMIRLAFQTGALPRPER